MKDTATIGGSEKGEQDPLYEVGQEFVDPNGRRFRVEAIEPDYKYVVLPVDSAEPMTLSETEIRALAGERTTKRFAKSAAGLGVVEILASSGAEVLVRDVWSGEAVMRPASDLTELSGAELETILASSGINYSLEAEGGSINRADEAALQEKKKGNGS